MAILGAKPPSAAMAASRDRPLEATAESLSFEGSRLEVVSGSPKQGRKTTIAVMSSR
jgi:hypothetical protein